MIPITSKEKCLKIFMKISAVIYLVAGFAFVLLPEKILNAINQLSQKLLPKLPLIPLSDGKFWLILAFSMMMTITALCCLAQRNVRKYNGYIVSLLVAKFTSSITGLCFFLCSDKYFAYLLIFIVDGALLGLTLFFFIRAKLDFFKEHTTYFRKKPVIPRETEPTKVAVLKGDDKFQLLDQVLEQAGFWEVLDRRFQASGKSRENFSVVIKPNFMFLHHKKDISSYTDPELVEALIDKIAAKGYSNIAIVEAQSTYGNYYANWEVVTVAKYIGYSTEKNYRIADLTEEMVPYDYGGRFGQHFVGLTWRDADFRISFAKNKTHVFCNYTLTLKNIYGTLPMQDKLKEYHTQREYDWPTIESMKHFPVHFGLIDAIYSGDGQFGVMVDPKPNHTKTMIAGENLMAVDYVGAKKMGLNPEDPQVGRFLSLAWEAFGKPKEIIWIGDQSVYDPWQNVSDIFIKSLDLIEEAYAFSDWWFSGLTAMDEYFTFKRKALPIIILRKILAPLKRIFYKYDYLGS